MKRLKKLFRKVKKKLSPLLLIPIVLLALVLAGGYFLFFAGDDDNDGTASNSPDAPSVPNTPSKKKSRKRFKVKPAPAAGKEFTIDSDRDEKDYAIAQAIGSITTPGSISVRIGAAPKQPVTVNWSIVCLLTSEGARTTDDTFTVTPPATRQLKLPVKNAVSCNASVAAQLTRAGNGRIKVFLLGVRRAGE
ncbi:MAG: hypothetical protein M3401_17845 [Actinomycetota bacterium]|nr:hypothetical protein [Actinomycetota bacterium]